MAILTKTQLSASNATSFPDNTTGLITPALLRNFNTSSIDSYASLSGSNTFVGNQIEKNTTNVTVNNNQFTYFSFVTGSTLTYASQSLAKIMTVGGLDNVSTGSRGSILITAQNITSNEFGLSQTGIIVRGSDTFSNPSLIFAIGSNTVASPFISSSWNGSGVDCYIRTNGYNVTGSIPIYKVEAYLTSSATFTFY
jgi:hypothetical protein